MDLEWCKKVAPTVMSDDLLKECSLKDYCETEEAKRIVEAEGFEFSTVEVLRMEFKNILRISNLEPFTSLRTLVLSNNCIEVIEGLDSLINLTTLDLSFNNIVEIGGIKCLQSLEDLNLSHNKIQDLTGDLVNLKKLRVLALNDNKISTFISFEYAYEAVSIESVCLTGNPICEDPNYHLKTLSYMPNLQYLDYRLISFDAKKQALETYHDLILCLEKKVALEKALAEERMKKEKQEAFYDAALLVGIHNYQFLDELIDCDEQYSYLLKFSAFHNLNEFVNTMRNIFDAWVKMSSEQYRRRKEEAENYLAQKSCVIEAAVSKSRAEMFMFMEYKEKALEKLVFHDVNNEKEHYMCKKSRNSFYKKIDSLWRSLMGKEMDLAEHLELMHKVLETDLPQMGEEFFLKLRVIMEQISKAVDDIKNHAFSYYQKWCKKDDESKDVIIKTAGSDISGLCQEQIDVWK